MLMLVYDYKENIVAMSQAPGDLTPLPISMDIPRGRTGGCFGVWKNLDAAIEESGLQNYSQAESEQGSDEEGTHPAEERPS